MTFDKEQIKKELDQLLLKRKIFLIISLSLFAVSIGLSIAYIILMLQKTISDNTAVILSVTSDITFCAAIVMLILRSVFYSFKVNVRRAILNGQVQIQDLQNIDPNMVNTVDVKPAEGNVAPVIKTREQELVDQYEDLYKKGYISKEDFEAKKKELLG